MESTKLIFIPGPGMGHLAPAAEFGKLLTTRDHRLSVVYLIINLPPINTSVPSNLTGTNSQLSFIEIPPPVSSKDQEPTTSNDPTAKRIQLIDRYKPNVRDALFLITSSSQVAGVFLDMFLVNMIDVANEFGLPSYTFYTSGAGFLGLHLHSQFLKDERNQDVGDYKDTDFDLSVPSFASPVPAKVLPTTMLDKTGGSDSAFSAARRIRETKGIVLNTFLELEEYAMNALFDQEGIIPRIYPIGPMIRSSVQLDDWLESWLNDKPTGSVVFLCFGSFGSFKKEQVKEIALALERCGYPFLWSLRLLLEKGETSDHGREYENLDEFLPEGFMERTLGVGKVIGWAPQTEILAHPGVGGFVSHCGWNSILESLRYGVPIAAWPIYAEQQVNAFEMVVELELAAEIRMDYRNEGKTESNFIVSAEEIEKGIKKIMVDQEKNVVKKKVKEMQERSQKAIMEEGSSYIHLGHLIADVMSCIPKKL